MPTSQVKIDKTASVLPAKQRVDDRLRRIANVLLLNASFIDSLGLLNGKMGIAIFFYNYARCTDNKIFEDYAGELIDEIYEEINTNTHADFANGLTGIGWGIEYLVKNKFLEADTDEALAEIDNAVYRYWLQSPVLLDNSKDLFGYGLYYISRLLGHDINDDNLNTLIKKHHLIFLTDECERLLIHKRYLVFNILTLSLGTINSILWFLLEMYKLGLFPSKVDKLLQCLPDFLVFSPNDNGEQADRFVFCCLAQKVVESIFDKALQKKYQIVSERMKKEFDSVDNDHSLVNYPAAINLYEMIYTLYINGDVLEYDLFERAFKVIDNEENWNQRIDKIDKNNLGLTGLAGLGLYLLNKGGLNNIQLSPVGSVLIIQES